MTSKKIKITYDLKVVLNKFKSLRFQLEKDWSSNRLYDFILKSGKISYYLSLFKY